MSLKFSLVALLATTFPCWNGQICQAQSPSSGFEYPYEGSKYRSDPFYGWGRGYHCSTAFEGYARGWADVIRAKGENNLNNARAQREWESAYKQNLDNQLYRVRVRYEKREIYNQQQAKLYAKRRDKLETHLARIRLTALTPQELNPETGEIAWPILLADDAFSDYSIWFNELFAERAKYGHLQPAILGEAENIIKQWRSELTAAKDQMPLAVLKEGLRFLLRLDLELERQLI